jgi:hypothetical protein
MFEIRPGLYHALAGCRPEKAVFPGPLLTSKACLDERSIAINVTCAARHEGYKKAKRMALDILRKEKFLFALDIATARRCGITPLPFSGRPQESPVVLKVDRRAKELAEKIGAQTGYKVYTPTHLLLALLYDGDGFTRQAFLKGRLDINKTKSILEDGLKNIRPKKRVDTLKHSEHYDAVWAFASNMAKSEGSPFVLEKHVFLALLETASQALDMALAAMKTDRRALKRDARLLLETEPFFDGEKSIFGSFCPSE